MFWSRANCLVGVTIQVEVTPQAIDQALVIRVIRPEAAVRATSIIPKVHEIVARCTESSEDRKRKSLQRQVTLSHHIIISSHHIITSFVGVDVHIICVLLYYHITISPW